MKIGLVSYECKNRDKEFNMRQIERAMAEAKGKADLVCFGEAFLQGFDSLSWKFETDRQMAVTQDSPEIAKLCEWTKQYGVSLSVGYIEHDGEKLYSSYITIVNGGIISNYRRISQGWKEVEIADEHYCEGDTTAQFELRGKKITVALCGDLWEFPERFQTDDLLLWPVYVNYAEADWNDGILVEYAEQAAKAADDVLMINPLDTDPVNVGGSFRFRGGKVVESIPFGKEAILIVKC